MPPDPAAGSWDSYARRPHLFTGVDDCALYERGLAGLAGTYADIGAGDGLQLGQSLDAGRLAAFSRVLAFDISPERVRRLRRQAPGVEAQVGDALHLPLPAASVDFAISDQVIEHVGDDRAMARELSRVLAPGGRALVGSVLRKRGAWFFYRCNGSWRIDPTHVREYASLAEYTSVFTDVGLEVVEASAVPLAYSFGDLGLRALLALRALRPEAAVELRRRSHLLAGLSGLSLRIPRYCKCYALVRHPGQPSATALPPATLQPVLRR